MLLNKEIKFIIVGAWNTLFGLGLYSLLIILFGESHYLLLNILTWIISITNSYICHKLFVFKTHDTSIFKEYVKFCTVYLLSFFIGLLLMYLLVDIAKISAIISNILVTFLLTVVSFVGHNNYTFKN